MAPKASPIGIDVPLSVCGVAKQQDQPIRPAVNRVPYLQITIVGNGSVELGSEASRRYLKREVLWLTFLSLSKKAPPRKSSHAMLGCNGLCWPTAKLAR